MNKDEYPSESEVYSLQKTDYLPSVKVVLFLFYTTKLRPGKIHQEVFTFLINTSRAEEGTQ